jgi:DNA-binding transcriptional MerR regulator
MFNRDLKFTIKTILEILDKHNVSIQKIYDSISILKFTSERQAKSIERLTLRVAQLDKEVQQLKGRNNV